MQNKAQNSDDLLPDEENFSDPYQVIANFFDLCSISDHRAHISTWLEAVNSNDYWQESSPSELIFYYRRLVNLVKAVHQIYKETGERKTAIDLLEEKGYDVRTNLLHPALYVGWVRNHTLWNYFPRNLNQEEYIDPYLVFPPFFELYELDEWCKELRELLSDGLSSDNPAELFGLERDMLLIQKNLFKLVEAAHLIDVREVDYIDDFKKRQPYTLDKPCTDIPMTDLLRMSLSHREELGLPDEIEQTEDNENDDKHYDDDHEERDEENKENDKEEPDEDEDKREEDETYDNDDEEIEAGDLQEDDEKEADFISRRQGQGSVEISIRGNYLVNDRLMPFKPVKINIPIKGSMTE